ncbi:hypothetical protein HKD37_09G025726 [Glycine soja]
MEDITHHQRTYRHDSYIMFLIIVDVELNGPSGRMMEWPTFKLYFPPCFTFCFSYFPLQILEILLFLYLVHFLSTFNPLITATFSNKLTYLSSSPRSDNKLVELCDGQTL